MEHTGKTKRAPFLKLSLGDRVHDQLSAVATTLYKYDEGVPKIKSRHCQSWNTTDEKLFKGAKDAYDGILEKFADTPKVYKLNSIKEKIWQYNFDNNIGLPPGKVNKR